MIRFAVPPIGGEEWFGGLMYMRNVVHTLALYGDGGIETCVFVGPERAETPYIAEMRTLPHTTVLVDRAFEGGFRSRGIFKTLATGRRGALLEVFRREKIDVALDWATYLGWRSEIPTIAWMPDFQHRALPHLFSRLGWFRREAGFRLQIAASAKILLSSVAAERDCHAYYHSSRGKTHVARFTVPNDSFPEVATAEKMLKSAGIPRDFIFLPNQLWQHKNHLLAIEAASFLAQRGSQRIIVATGCGSDPRKPNLRSELMNRIEASGAAANFMLLDSVSYELVKAMLIMTNALLNPSKFEGWSTPVEEAKAIGTPMILSDIPAHREQAPDAKFFALNDAAMLADLIDASPVRTINTIVSSKRAAVAQNVELQRAFAQSVTTAVKGATGRYASEAGQ